MQLNVAWPVRLESSAQFACKNYKNSAKVAPTDFCWYSSIKFPLLPHLSLLRSNYDCNVPSWLEGCKLVKRVLCECRIQVVSESALCVFIIAMHYQDQPFVCPALRLAITNVIPLKWCSSSPYYIHMHRPFVCLSCLSLSLSLSLSLPAYVFECVNAFWH